MRCFLIILFSFFRSAGGERKMTGFMTMPGILAVIPIIAPGLPDSRAFLMKRDPAQ